MVGIASAFDVGVRSGALATTAPGSSVSGAVTAGHSPPCKCCDDLPTSWSSPGIMTLVIGSSSDVTAHGVVVG